MKIEELRKLLRKATPGPVKISDEDIDSIQVVSISRHCCIAEHEDYEDAELHVTLRNHADALLDCAEALMEALAGRGVPTAKALAALTRLGERDG